jgi:muramidase (phage lysozyme)
MTKNEKAFLDTIAYAELGEHLLKESNDGYDIIVGSVPPNRILYLQDYSDHPRVYVKQVNSTAAGRYQILKRIYDFYKKFLGLKDFSPKSQDAIALQLLKECKALQDIEAGNFEEAVFKARSRWASLPGAGYGQRERKIEDLKNYFIKMGGTTKDGKSNN